MTTTEPSDTARPPAVRPLRLAAVLLLALLGSGVVALGLTYERLMVRELTEITRQHAIEVAQTLKGIVREDLATTDPTTPAERARLISRMRQVIQTAASVLPVVKMHVYGPDGTILASTDSRAMGDNRATNPRFKLAMTGETFSDFTTQNTFRLFGETVTSDKVFATYLPVRGDVPGHPIVAVMEVYQDVSDPMNRITATTHRLTLISAGIMGALYLALLLALRHLDGVVRRQHAAIQHEATERQEALVHLRRVQDAMETTILERTRRLRESEARFRDFAESASDWLWEVDEQMRYTFISEGFRRIVGLDPVVLLGHRRNDLVELMVPEDHERWHRHEEDLRAHRGFRDLRYSLRLPDGQRRTVAASGSPIIDERGRFRGYRGTTSDITGREQAEQTIVRLGRIVDQSANEVYIFEAGTLRFLQVNRGARRNLGLAMEDLARLRPVDIIPDETEATLTRRLEPLRQNPAISSVFETVFQRQDGSRYPVEVRLQYMAHERPPVFVAVVQDITERRRAQQALLESEERYRSIAEMSLDAIVVHVDDRIVYANGQAVTVAGADSIDDLVGQPLTRYIQPDFLGVVTERLRTVIGTGRTSERTEVILMRQNGAPFDAEISSSSIAYGGRPAVQTVVRDISEDKAVQSQLIQTAKLATLGEMAAGMAHELSQPMNVIRMAAEGALLGHDQSGEPLSAELRKALGIITSQAGRMGEIIDHMRIFSRKEAEAEEVFDPGLCVRQALNMVEVQFYAEDIAITARYPAASVAIRGRPVHLEQVLLNLLTNARDAIRSRVALDGEGAIPGRITIDMRLDKSDSTPDLIIALTDNGGGIPPETLDRVFEPFYTTKEVGTGTGLGLSVSFGLIAAMRGTITVTNHPGEGGGPPGARFQIRLPMADPAALTQPRDTDDLLAAAPILVPPGPPLLPEDEDDGPSALQLHILVVDDEPFATRLVSDHLTHLGYRVTMASDGVQAYEAFLADPPDLVITDLRMPRSDGAELMRRIHDHVPELPVILVTGHLGHLEDSSLSLEQEAVAVIKKPVSLARLSTLVHQYVGDPVSTKDALPAEV